MVCHFCSGHGKNKLFSSSLHKISALVKKNFYSLLIFFLALLMIQSFCDFRSTRPMPLLAIDTALLAERSPLSPPDGVTPNFVNPESCANMFRLVAYTSLSIMISFLLLRIYTQAILNRKFGTDDCECSVFFSASSSKKATY